MFIYCKTKDSPKNVGDEICRENFVEDSAHLWLIKDEGDFFSIMINSESRCVAIVCSISDSVVGIEIDTNCASKVIETLIKLYGFENVKWLLTK